MGRLTASTPPEESSKQTPEYDTEDDSDSSEDDSDSSEDDVLDLPLEELCEELAERVDCLIELGPGLDRVRCALQRSTLPSLSFEELDRMLWSPGPFPEILQDYWILRRREMPSGAFNLKDPITPVFFFDESATSEELVLVHWLQSLKPGFVEDPGLLTAIAKPTSSVDSIIREDLSTK